MFTAHVQEQVQTQSSSQCQEPQVILSRRQLELLGLTELDTPRVSLLGLGLNTRQVNEVQDTQFLASIFNVGIIKPKGVVSTHHIWVLSSDLKGKLVEHVFLRLTRNKFRIVIRCIYSSDYIDHTSNGFQELIGPTVGDTHLDDRITLLGLWEETRL